MTAPSWLHPVLGWRRATAKQEAFCERHFGKPYAPNIADASSHTSARIAGIGYEMLKVTRHTDVDLSDTDDDSGPEGSTGIRLENLIRDDLRNALAAAGHAEWAVDGSRQAANYRQFAHLSDLQELFMNNPTLRSTIGQDYQVKTDVCVGVPHPRGGQPLLHAAVSSKWTLRSDRAQNVRHEFATLVRNRRGRLPHLILVTAEPLPTRLLSIARGTGEIDAVYHLLFDELAAGVKSVTAGGRLTKQLDAWTELVGQRRVLPYADLAPTLAAS